MKKMILFTAISFFTLGSCQKEVATPTEKPVLTINQLPAIAGTARNDNAAVPFHGSFDESLDGVQLYNSCTNEQMTLYGTIHYVSHGFDDGPHDGTDLKTTFHYNLTGTVSAVGESGTEYSVTGTLNAQEGDFSPGEFTYKFVNKYRFFTKGGGNNFFYELTHYLKVDDQGNWTIIRGEVEKTYCR